MKDRISYICIEIDSLICYTVVAALIYLVKFMVWSICALREKGKACGRVIVQNPKLYLAVASKTYTCTLPNTVTKFASLHLAFYQIAALVIFRLFMAARCSSGN